MLLYKVGFKKLFRNVISTWTSREWSDVEFWGTGWRWVEFVSRGSVSGTDRRLFLDCVGVYLIGTWRQAMWKWWLVRHTPTPWRHLRPHPTTSTVWGWTSLSVPSTRLLMNSSESSFTVYLWGGSYALFCNSGALLLLSDLESSPAPQVSNWINSRIVMEVIWVIDCVCKEALLRSCCSWYFGLVTKDGFLFCKCP